MQHPLDAVLFAEELSSEQRTALREALDKDPALAAAFARWQQVRAAVRDRLASDLPEHRLLVLYALDYAGHAETLTDAERRDLNEARADLETALHRHPALADVVQDVDAACADFEEVWARHTVPDDEASSRSRPARPRGPRRAAAPSRADDRRPASRTKGAARWAWRIGTTVAVVLFAALAVLLVQRDGSLTTLEVAEGQTRVVTLADGSTVRVLGGSVLTYADPGEATLFNRRVTLEGRAFFEVVSGQQGFSVETPTGVTTVLGTSFGIRADDEAMNVVLASGQVAVASREAPEQVVVLEPGQQSRVARNALPTTPTPVELTDALSRTGLFVFRATPLQEVAATLQAHYDVPVEVVPPLAEERVTGTFEQEQSLDHVLGVLATTLHAEVRGTATDGYTLAPDLD